MRGRAGSSGSASRARAACRRSTTSTRRSPTSRESWALLDTVCARLMRYRDRPPPAGYRIVPEVAAALPQGLARREDDHVHAAKRLPLQRRQPGPAPTPSPTRSTAPWHRASTPPPTSIRRRSSAPPTSRQARRSRAAGVTARGNTLTVRFTREVRDFAAWTTMPFFCAVPPTLPPSAEGVRTFPGAGPYTIREYRPNERIVLRRNRYYGGQRAHHVDGFHVDLSASSPAGSARPHRSTAKPTGGTRHRAPFFDPDADSSASTASTTHRFQVRSGPDRLAMFVFNSSRPLFKDNPRLRRAVNLALNRTMFQIRGAERPSTTSSCRRSCRDSGSAGSIRSRETWTVRRRSRAGTCATARPSLYAPASPLKRRRSCQIAEATTGGARARGRDPGRSPSTWTTTSAYLGRLGDPDEPWDLALILWTPDFVDPLRLHQPAARRAARPAAPTLRASTSRAIST